MAAASAATSGGGGISAFISVPCFRSLRMVRVSLMTIKKEFGYNAFSVMAQPKDFAPVKLVCGVIYKEDAVCGEVKRRLEAEWGRIDSESPAFPFDLTDYYEAEMGPGLVRRFVSFETLMAPESLPEKKIRAIAIEESLRRERGTPGRPVNIDPGYLTASALIMATAKDFAHRVPLAKGIYAHLELLFAKSGARVLDWTYPDLRRGPAQAYLLAVRADYLRRLRDERPA